jgi:hypothetical protein
MDAKTCPCWLRAVLFGVAYFSLGMLISALARSTASNHARVIWRLAAWGVSGVIYLSHIAYEHFRLRQLPSSIAVHAASGATLGAFGLAVAAAIHIHSLTNAPFRPAYLVALVAWPALIALPALLVALAVAAALARLPRRSQR